MKKVVGVILVLVLFAFVGCKKQSYSQLIQHRWSCVKLIGFDSTGSVLYTAPFNNTDTAYLTAMFTSDSMEIATVYLPFGQIVKSSTTYSIQGDILQTHHSLLNIYTADTTFAILQLDKSNLVLSDKMANSSTSSHREFLFVKM